MSSSTKPRRNSRQKGATFERRIATDLREIYDSPGLRASIAEATPKDRAGILKLSRVRRSDQGRGALEPDIVVTDQRCPVWLELQHADRTTPTAKLEQAERDVAAARHAGRLTHQYLPAAITNRTGAREPVVTMRLGGLTELITGGVYRQARSLLAVTVGYSEFLEILKGRASGWEK